MNMSLSEVDEFDPYATATAKLTLALMLVSNSALIKALKMRVTLRLQRIKSESSRINSLTK